MSILYSYRTTPLSVTEKNAMYLCKKYGITRVTDTTKLDIIGMPVYAAIRPNAEKGSLCVSSGKSTCRQSAKIGAMVEALELRMAEIDLDRDTIHATSIKKFEEKLTFPIEEFCLHRQWLLAEDWKDDKTIRYVEGDCLISNKKVPIPLELVFFPIEKSLNDELFISSSNGLSGGNTKEEAIVHSLFEVIERHVLSISNVTFNQTLVTEYYVHEFENIKKKLDSIGIDIKITYCQNEFGLPMFVTYLIDSQIIYGVSICRGQGLHWNKDIAFMRAVTEAIQSRLTNIHGGRDDIVNRYHHFNNLKEEEDSYNYMIKSLEGLDKVKWGSIKSVPFDESFEEQTIALSEILVQNGYDKIFIYDLSNKHDALKFVKLVVPKLEYYSPEYPRIGIKLLEVINNE